MTSGSFHFVPVDSIQIQRDRRQRREINRVEELADSLSRLGLIHPIVITREKVLVAGERRLMAAKSIGWTTIAIQYTDEVDERALAAIELEENIKRRDIPWQDQVSALAAFHDLHLGDDPTWTIAKTGEAIGLDRTTVNHHLEVAKRLAAGDERVISAERLSTAKGLVKRANERKRRDEAVIVQKVTQGADLVLIADFNEWVETYEGPSFTFIHCDFPYGIEIGSGPQTSAKSFGKYDDSEAVYWKLLGTLLANAERLLGEGGHVLFWFSMKHYTNTLALLQKQFWVDPFPLIWHKDDNSGTLPWPDKSTRRVYETAFLCSYGDRKIVHSVSNVFAAPLVQTGEHMSEKNEVMLAHYFQMFIDENARVLDPTCGSGSALRAALRRRAKTVLGLEINPEFARSANELLAKRRR